MSYFDRFPLMIYDVKNDGNYKLLPDILRRVKQRNAIKSGQFIFDTYDVRNGETPESIADKLYNDSQLHWVVLMINNISDRFHDWPMTEAQFLEYINDKYDNLDAIHHYEIPQESGDTSIKINIGTSNSDYPTATAITNYEHEQEVQDAKRKIRLLDPSYITTFVAEFRNLMKESNI